MLSAGGGSEGGQRRSDGVKKSMFEWFEAEMAQVNTNKFFLVDGPASPELRRAIESSDFPIPKSYRDFVLRFGNSRLYRRSSYWLVEVYAGPREEVSKAGEPLIHFGRTESSLAYFKENLLVEDGESPVFEWRHGQGLRHVSDSFPVWLEYRCGWARKQYSPKEWKAIQEGPPPFTERELEVVNARRKFRSQIVGIAPSGDLVIEISNSSTLTLPYLTIGIRGELKSPNSGPLNGAVRIPVGSIGPGKTSRIQHNCCKSLVRPEDVEFFDLPDPEPEDRQLYWEFRQM